MFSMSFDGSKKAIAKLDLHIQELRDGTAAAMEEVGIHLEGKMAEKIATGQLSPPLSKEYEIRKGKKHGKDKDTTILQDDGDLLLMITSKNPTPFEVEVGVFNDQGKNPRATIAMYHEFGAPAAGIPERSFIRSTVAEQESQVRKIFKKHTDFSKK